MRFALLIVCLCIAPLVVSAQNVDIENDPVTADYIALQTLRGRMRLTSTAIAPFTLARITQSLSQEAAMQGFTALDESLARYISAYYTPIFSANTPYLPMLREANTTHWFAQQGGRFRALTYQDSLIRIMADAQIMSRFTSFDQTIPTTTPLYPTSPAGYSGNVGVGRLGARIMGNYANTIEFFLELTNGRTAGGKDSVALLTDPLLVGSTKFFEDNFFDRYRGYIQAQWKHFRVRYGRDRMSIGFSPIDNLALSARTAPMDGLVADMEYGGFRFTSIHAGIEGLDTSNRAVINKFFALHRISFEPSDQFAFAVTDMMIYSGRGVDFTYLNPVSFYVSAGLGTLQKNRDDNSSLQFDVAWRPKYLLPNTLIYGAWFIDDINVSTIGKQIPGANTNKFAFQVGASWTSETLPVMLTTEYVRIDPFVYAHRSMINGYTHFGRSIGYQMQPNSDRIALQARYWLAPRTTLHLEADYTRSGENYLAPNGKILTNNQNWAIGNVGSDIARGDDDVLTYRAFLSGNRADMRRIRATLSSEFFTNIFCDLNLQYESRSGGNAPRTAMTAWLELRVGY
jgi:hypothetical protein